LPFAGTAFGDLIDFARIDSVAEYAKAKGISQEDAATEAIFGNRELVKATLQGDSDARAGRFVSRENVYGDP
jgi:hypothetical protein